MIDPPQGWKYGFPKPIPQEVLSHEKTLKWLVEQGYPQEEIDKYKDKFYCRYWESSDVPEEDFCYYTKGSRMDDNYEYFSHQLKEDKEEK